MSESNLFRGVLAPVLTPFDNALNPDIGRFVTHAKWLLDDGCTGLAPFGTTGEALSLGLDERIELLDALVDSGVEGGLLMPGTGLCSIPDTVRLTRHAVERGCAGVMMLPPFYYKGMSDDGVFNYFTEIIQRVGDDRLKIYLYHIPPQAVIGFSLDLVGRLIEAFPDTVVGLKDSSGDWSNTKALLDAFPGFATLAGSEVFLLDTLRGGGAGCITATGNVNARRIRNVFDKWETSQADDLQAEITAMRLLVQSKPMIPMLKHLVATSRADAGWTAVRPPFTDLAQADARTVIDQLASDFGFSLEVTRAAA
ncbi:MAG: 4-hydroxy-tetrahydrodipicolinate synthase [Gammaproteobacteria bacterium]|jgi:4-hydroxy-tetrahydrodipicolinate synthase